MVDFDFDDNIPHKELGQFFSPKFFFFFKFCFALITFVHIVECLYVFGICTLTFQPKHLGSNLTMFKLAWMLLHDNIGPIISQ